MADDPEYHAELHNAAPAYDGRYVGDIHKDTKGRFRDGERVRTSRAVKVVGSILHTANTRYLLVNPI